MNDSIFSQDQTRVERKIAKGKLDLSFENSKKTRLDPVLFGTEFQQAFNANDHTELRVALMDPEGVMMVSEEEYEELCAIMEQCSFDEAHSLLADLQQRKAKRTS